MRALLPTLMLATKNYTTFEIQDPITGIILESWTGAEKTGRALPGDIVRMTTEKTIELISRAEKKPLVGILQLTSKYMYGITSHGVPLYCCQPMNKGYPSFRVACKERDRSYNLLVSFQFESWDEGAELPRGGLLKVLGRAENPEAEAEALAILSSPWTTPFPINVACLGIDRPLLKQGTFNIDPPGCLDIDDVITLKKRSDSTYTIWITIADVSESVKSGDKVYSLAEKIGATSYQDGKAVRPMIHSSLSEKQLSLLPGEERNGLALEINFDILSGKRSVPVFKKVRVQNQQRFTYESVLTSGGSEIQTVFIAFSGSSDPHVWIETCMLLYNREAAKIINKSGCGLLRSHGAPFLERLSRLDSIDPTLRYLAYQSASYCSVADGGAHWGLNESLYCHASSPLRRFADLVNQQIIKDYLDGVFEKRTLEADTRLALQLNRRQKEIQRAERDYSVLKAIQTAEQAIVEGVFLWNSSVKSEFYVKDWKSTIRVSTDLICIPGQKYTIQYYCDRRKASWKERMIYRVQGKSGTECCTHDSGL